jgi:hypothetical protein
MPPEGSDLIFDHRHNAAMRAALADATDAELDVPQADVTPADTAQGVRNRESLLAWSSAGG